VVFLVTMLKLKFDTTKLANNISNQIEKFHPSSNLRNQIKKSNPSSNFSFILPATSKYKETESTILQEEFTGCLYKLSSSTPITTASEIVNVDWCNIAGRDICNIKM
jgi:hypothetical protein